MNSAEFDLQMRGLAAAFRTQQVQAALQATGDLGVAVALIQWSENRSQYLAVDWMKITDRTGAEALAQAIDDAPRYLVGGGTAISGAIDYSLQILEENVYDGRRKVIDISGDYYREVVGGTGAFVITANDFQAYAKAIIDKLVKEISGTPIVEGPQSHKIWYAQAGSEVAHGNALP